MATNSHMFLDIGSSDDSGDDRGYDSEAAEQAKGGAGSSSGIRSVRPVASASLSRARKRRKLSPTTTDDGDEESDYDSDLQRENATGRSVEGLDRASRKNAVEQDEQLQGDGESTTGGGGGTHAIAPPQPREATSPKPAVLPTTSTTTPIASAEAASSAKKRKNFEKASSTEGKKTKTKKELRPGVVYLSSLPPYLRPSALKNLLTHRGFSPITRLFLSPASKSRKNKSASSASSTTTRPTSSSKRTLYAEGWIEFASHRTARLCAETLNAAPVGGPKGGFYHDDLWNMRYLRGMGWVELMAGVREERREEEGRRDEERRVIARETKAFVEGVERGRIESGMMKKRKGKKKKSLDGVTEGGEGGDEGMVVGESATAATKTGVGKKTREADEDQIKRTWRQFQVKGGSAVTGTERNQDKSQQQQPQSPNLHHPHHHQKTKQTKNNTHPDPNLPDNVRRVLSKIF